LTGVADGYTLLAPFGCGRERRSYMDTSLVEKLLQKINETQNAHEAEAWSHALRNVFIAIGISENLKSDDIRQCLAQKCLG